MQTVVIVIHLMIVLAMIFVVLLQKSEGGGLGMGGGTGGFLSSRGTANVLTRATALLATGFFLTSLALSILAGLDRKPKSILPTTPASAPAQHQPPSSLPPLEVPDSLRGGGKPSAPPPQTPQVPQSH